MRMMNRRLNILQYNVQKSRTLAMIPLFNCGAIAQYDIIAIQEPWQNPRRKTTHQPLRSGFRLYYYEDDETKVCFYVNRRIPASACEWQAASARLATLTIHLDRTIHIHNMYNPPQEYTAGNTTVIESVRSRLSWPGEHLLLGDFNLHHPLWGGPLVRRTHSAADALIDITQEAGIGQRIPPGTITREGQEGGSTLDLIFTSEYLAERMLSCDIDETVQQISDHRPIGTKFDLQTPEIVDKPRPNWKEMDRERAQRRIEASVPYERLEEPWSKDKIDGELNSLINVCHDIIKETVP